RLRNSYIRGLQPPLDGKEPTVFQAVVLSSPMSRLPHWVDFYGRAARYLADVESSNSTLTVTVPFSLIPSASAAARERSITRPARNGPLSLIGTSIDLPLSSRVTLTLLPKGKDR